MAKTGLLGKVEVTAINADTAVCTITAGVQFATASIYCVNKNAAEATVRISIGSATPGSADYIEYDAKIPAAGGVLERECLVCSPGEVIVVRSNVTGVVVRVSGLEQA